MTDWCDRCGRGRCECVFGPEDDICPRCGYSDCGEWSAFQACTQKLTERRKSELTAKGRADLL